jgi:ATP-dependent Clp protease ATP-binding subunit ClpB
MTSNLGSDLILKEEDLDAIGGKIEALLKATFKPEFLNRIDETITFRRLGKDQILAIVDIQLAFLSKRLEERKITLSLDDDVKRFLADEGYDPAFGARPLTRAIQQHIQNPLAKKMLTGDFQEGDTISVSMGKEGLEFKKG